VFCEEEFQRVVQALLAQTHHTNDTLIAGSGYRGPNTGIRDRVDAPRLTDQDLERKTPFPESGMTVDNDLPDFPKSQHSVGTHLQRKTSIYQALEGVLLMGEVSGISS
jgi:hypothetical protein